MDRHRCFETVTGRGGFETGVYRCRDPETRRGDALRRPGTAAAAAADEGARQCLALTKRKAFPGGFGSRRYARLMIGIVSALAMGASMSTGHCQTQLTTMVFQGVQNLPLFAAQQKGFFANHSLAVDQRIAPNSQELREGLAQGRYQLVHTAVDNAIAMAEQAKVDIVVVLGGDNGWNDFIVQPEINGYADLRGKTVVVDAPDTAFAFQLYQMLKLHGIGLSEITVKSAAAAMLNLPFSFQAQQAGLKKLATAVDVIGPYLATAGFMLRSWARENPDTLVRYIAAYVEALRWVMQPSNRNESITMLANGLNISQDMAERSYAVAVDPQNGFARDAKIDMAGFRNVLKLRAELHGDWGGTPPAPEQYLDLSYYDRALAQLK
jgi:ABC-type nitrate/sulfonate/bicarbonate transport system substrate-binding protein